MSQEIIRRLQSQQIAMPEGWDKRGNIKIINREGREYIVIAHPDMPPKELDYMTKEWKDI